MNRSHAKETTRAARGLEDRHLDGHRTGFHHVHSTDQRKQEVCVGADCEQTEGGADAESPHVAHEDPRWCGVPPQESTAGSGEPSREHREVERIHGSAREHSVHLGITERPVADDRERQESEEGRATRETVESVGDVDRVGGGPHHERGPHDPQPPRDLPARPIEARERDRFRDVGCRHQPPRDAARHGERDVALLLPEDAAVVALVDLDHVIEQAHTRHHDDADPDDHRLIGEREAIANVCDDPTDERGADDRQTAHGRSSRLLLVMLRSVVFLAEDRLTLAAIAEEGDEEASREQRHEHGRGSGDHHRDHERPSRNSRATTRSSKGITVLPMVWVIS